LRTFKRTSEHHMRLQDPTVGHEALVSIHIPEAKDGTFSFVLRTFRSPSGTLIAMVSQIPETRPVPTSPKAAAQWQRELQTVSMFRQQLVEYLHRKFDGERFMMIAHYSGAAQAFEMRGNPSFSLVSHAPDPQTEMEVVNGTTEIDIQRVAELTGLDRATLIGL